MGKEIPFYRVICCHIMAKDFIYVFFCDRDSAGGSLVGEANRWVVTGVEALTAV
ncbi:MAG: hypothetical protein JRJ20_03105 [Deltaproteobacteria bacterium]|nr:hypothetical protein [Deltaproteobacteria bacterium]